MEDSDTSLKTQSSTVKFKKGKEIDFSKLAQAVDKAGFKASEIKVWATGTIEQADGKPSLKVSGSNQTFSLKGEESKLKGLSGKQVTVVGKVEFDKKPVLLVIEDVEK